MRLRRLWWLGVAVLGVALVAAACGGDDDDDAGSDGTPEGGESGDSNPTPDPDATSLAVGMAAESYYVGGPNNIAFALVDPETGQQVTGENIEVTFFDLEDGGQKAVATVKASASAPGVQPETTHVHADGSEHVHGGEADNREVYYARFDGFTYAGLWGMLVEGDLPDGGQLTANLAFNVFPDSRIPAPGDPAILSDNLVASEVDDIRTIDSGEVPTDMHDVKIKDAIEAGRPLVVVFSTPAFCTTQFCGPVLNEMAELQEEWRDAVDFVHIEIWMDFEATQLNPTAEEWLVREDGGLTEPWVYVIGSDGVIFDRWEGPSSKALVGPAVEAVAGGAVWGEG